jgi:hypothetical protein
VQIESGIAKREIRDYIEQIGRQSREWQPQACDRSQRWLRFAPSTVRAAFPVPQSTTLSPLRNELTLFLENLYVNSTVAIFLPKTAC